MGEAGIWRPLVEIEGIGLLSNPIRRLPAPGARGRSLPQPTEEETTR